MLIYHIQKYAEKDDISGQGKREPWHPDTGSRERAIKDFEGNTANGDG